MSKLEELIAELCPDGVAFYPLEQVAHYAKKRIDASQVNEQSYVGVENLLQNKQGKTVASSVPANGAVIAFEVGDILIGNIRPYLRKIWLADCDGGTNGDVLAVQIEDKGTLMPKFLYYVLSSEDFFLYDIQNSKGAKMPRGSKEAVLNYQVPVPPLPVQSEIVRILDDFTEFTAELIAELTAELTARQKQYEYYRDKLLTFDVLGGVNNCQQRTLGEVCCLKTGKSIPASEISSKQTSEYPIPCFGGNGLHGYVRTANQQGDKTLIGRQGALCGNVCYATGEYYATEHAVVVTDKGHFNSRFLYHMLAHKDLNQYKMAGAQSGLSVAKLEIIEVPVPEMTIQNRIAYVLDNFEAICSDLKIGLSAESETRQKQYEFYRDSLLAFAVTGEIIANKQTEYDGLIRLCQYVFGYVFVTLPDISENCDSQRKPVTSSSRIAGEYPYYGASGIVDYVNDYLFDGEFLLVSEDGANLLARSTPIAFSISGKNWVNNHAHVLRFESYATRRYVEFYLNSIDLSQFISGGAQPKLNQQNLNRIRVPLPPQARQEYIVAILDRFDALCNDLASGLPAEIEARRKQYEYYRDKLLAFSPAD